MNLLVSACLLGAACKYSGTGNFDPRIAALAENHHLIPVCPEQLGGLPTPRKTVEIAEGRALDRDGLDVTAQFIKGAEESLKLARLLRCNAAILKSRSPSCGHGSVYDGTFSGKSTVGNGLTADLLCKAGIKVFSEEELSAWSEFERSHPGV
ncbi:MAG TPA: purine-nucleoside phosphorylase [Peptococcaceae bacterium]|nr:purine-nucleoside phosphorylase [Peptococcaceae bacterium]